MTTDDAKKVLEMLSKGKEEIPKETVFEIIDMIKADGCNVVNIPWHYPTTAPSTDETYPKITWSCPSVTCNTEAKT